MAAMKITGKRLAQGHPASKGCRLPTQQLVVVAATLFVLLASSPAAPVAHAQRIATITFPHTNYFSLFGASSQTRALQFSANVWHSLVIERQLIGPNVIKAMHVEPGTRSVNLLINVGANAGAKLLLESLQSVCAMNPDRTLILCNTGEHIPPGQIDASTEPDITTADPNATDQPDTLGGFVIPGLTQLETIIITVALGVVFLALLFLCFMKRMTRIKARNLSRSEIASSKRTSHAVEADKAFRKRHANLAMSFMKTDTLEKPNPVDKSSGDQQPVGTRAANPEADRFNLIARGSQRHKERRSGIDGPGTGQSAAKRDQAHRAVASEKKKPSLADLADPHFHRSRYAHSRSRSSKAKSREQHRHEKTKKKTTPTKHALADSLEQKLLQAELEDEEEVERRKSSTGTGAAEELPFYDAARSDILDDGDEDNGNGSGKGGRRQHDGASGKGSLQLEKLKFSGPRMSKIRSPGSPAQSVESREEEKMQLLQQAHEENRKSQETLGLHNNPADATRASSRARGGPNGVTRIITDFNNRARGGGI